jgi:3-deoxy-D-manno-octulosonate 8-phosphate phosphatase (KDO 8-P phosphatase)
MDGVVTPDIALRAARVKLVVTDCDGVLTDGGVYYSERGEELKRFNVRDGMGVELARGVGIDTAILTRDVSPSVQARGRKLKLEFVWVGVTDKRAHLKSILRETRRHLHEIAFIGDDVNDLGIIEEIGREGLTGAPADAVERVVRSVHHRTAARGGHGALRDFIDWIVQLRSST